MEPGARVSLDTRSLESDNDIATGFALILDE